MQYKIPIQIENEDPIVFGLSMRQLMIIFAGLGLGYGAFSSLAPITGNNAASVPAVLIVIIAVSIALFKYSEMTFMVFLFSILRAWVNQSERYWQKGTDSFSALDIGYIVNTENKSQKIDMGKKREKIKNLEEQLEKI
ncbi:hypothetical protein DLH72_02045 [Candidatus Gracilibacteria bacterium]|nr:MAG: hypothetical protein DLH72_02045 [Candidatus Gracilibacteria bacterium]